jgi:hypothetical protein
MDRRPILIQVDTFDCYLMSEQRKGKIKVMVNRWVQQNAIDTLPASIE